MAPEVHLAAMCKSLMGRGNIRFEADICDFRIDTGSGFYIKVNGMSYKLK